MYLGLFDLIFFSKLQNIHLNTSDVPEKANKDGGVTSAKVSRSLMHRIFNPHATVVSCLIKWTLPNHKHAISSVSQDYTDKIIKTTIKVVTFCSDVAATFVIWCKVLTVVNTV